MQINVTLKNALISTGVLLVIMAALAVAFTLNRRAYETRIVDLQNQVAARDKTLEVQVGVYQKLTIQANDLSKLVDSKDKQIVELKNQLDKTGAQLLTASSLIIQLKDQVAKGKATVVVTKPTTPDGKTTFAISRTENFGPFAVDCKMNGTEPVTPDWIESEISLTQPRLFKVSVIVSQDKDGTWRTTTTSSDEVFKVDIGLAAVNPYLLEPKWYEKIGFDTEVGLGSNPGLLAGIGASYQIGHFELGPKAWIVLDKGASPFFGASMTWHPFAK